MNDLRFYKAKYVHVLIYLIVLLTFAKKSSTSFMNSCKINA